MIGTQDQPGIRREGLLATHFKTPVKDPHYQPAEAFPG